MLFWAVHSKVEPMKGLALRLTPAGSVPYPGAHLGLLFRPLIPSDAPAIYDLIRETQVVDNTFHRVSAAQIADMLQTDQGRDWVDTIVGLDRDRKICAVASVRVICGSHTRADATLSAYTHPYWRGRGIGRAILYWQEGRARQMLVEAYGEECPFPASISNFVDAHMTDRRRLYIAAGFYAKCTYQVMFRELLGGEMPSHLRRGGEIRSWNEAELTDVHELFSRTWEDPIRPLTQERAWDEIIRELESSWSFVAYDADGQPVGFIAVARPAERWAATGRIEAHIRFLGVAAEDSERVIVTSLIRHAVAAAANASIKRIGVEVNMRYDADLHSVYEQLGFVDEQAEVYYTIDQ